MFLCKDEVIEALVAEPEFRDRFLADREAVLASILKLSEQDCAVLKTLDVTSLVKEVESRDDGMLRDTPF